MCCSKLTDVPLSFKKAPPLSMVSGIWEGIQNRWEGIQNPADSVATFLGRQPLYWDQRGCLYCGCHKSSVFSYVSVLSLIQIHNMHHRRCVWWMSMNNGTHLCIMLSTVFLKHPRETHRGSLWKVAFMHALSLLADSQCFSHLRHCFLWQYRRNLAYIVD